MNMIREFFNYFISVMLGRRDSLTTFLELLSMSERYLRWGVETGDIRDFRTAMDYIYLCHDRDAPMASLLIRKYNCIVEVASAAVETLLSRHQKVIESAVKNENKYREELELITKKVAEGKDYARKLTEEGSLIKAKAEESKIADLSTNLMRVKELLESGEGRTEVFASYDEITSDAMRFFRELDHASEMVMASDLLGERNASTLSNQLRVTLEHLQSRLEKANPISIEKSKGEKTGAPGVGPPKAVPAGVRRAGR